MDITKRQVVFLRRISLFRALHFRGIQKSSYLAHNGSHGLEIIAIAHQSDKRGNKSYGKNENHHKVIAAKRSATNQNPPNRKNGEEGCRHNGKRKGHRENIVSHPRNVAVCRFISVLYKACVTGLCFSKDFDDLNPSDIFHGGIVQGFRGFHGMLIKLLTATHHDGKAYESDRKSKKLGKSNSPIQTKNIEENTKGNQKVRREFRHNMRERGLHTVNPLDDRAF